MYTYKYRFFEALVNNKYSVKVTKLFSCFACYLLTSPMTAATFLLASKFR